MGKHYWRLLREIPAFFRGTVEAFVFWVTGALAAATWLWPVIPKFQSVISVPRWLGPVAFGIVVLYGLLRVNYYHVRRAQIETEGKQGVIDELNEMGPTVLGLAFASQCEAPGEFDVTADMQIRELSSFPDDWFLDVQLTNGRVVTVKGRFNAHSCPVGRYGVTAHFPFSSSIPDASALLGAKLLRLEGTDMRHRSFVYQPTPATASVGPQAASVERQQAVLFGHFTAELSKLTSAVSDLSMRLAGGATSDSPEVRQLITTASASAVATDEAWKLVVSYPGEMLHDSDFVHPSWSEAEQKKSNHDSEEPPSGESAS